MDTMPVMVEQVRARYKALKDAHPGKPVDFPAVLREVVSGNGFRGEDFGRKVKELSAAYATDKKKRQRALWNRNWGRTAPQ